MSRTDADRVAVFTAGWLAMKWLRKHATADCWGCQAYRRRVEAGAHPQQELHRRCAPAQEMHGRYMAVEKMLLEDFDGFDCDAADPRRPDILCDGPVRWALVERSRRTGRLVSYLIGCRRHVEHQEARAVAAGSADTFHIEELEQAVRENAAALRGGTR